MKPTIRFSLIVFFVFLYFSGNAALQWSNVGPAGFSGLDVFKPRMAMGPGSTPYAAYNDQAAGNRLTVKKFDGNNWVLVGVAGFSAGQIGDIAIAINKSGVPYVAYSDYTVSGQITVKAFNGTSWVNVGTPGFSADIVEDKSIAFDTSGQPFVIFKESPFNAEKIFVKHFDGATWQDVGVTGFSSNNTSVASIVTDTSGMPYIAYTARGSGFFTQQVAVRKFDGVNWTVTGGAISFTGGYSPSLALSSGGVLFVSYTEGLPYQLNVKMLDGNSWVSVGNANFSAGEAFYPVLKLDNNDIPYVAYLDYGNDFGITIKKLSGAVWTTVGVDNMSDISSAFPSLDFDAANIPYVGFQWGDEAGKPMVIRRFTTVPDFEAGTVPTGPHCPGGTVSIPFHITNGVFYPGNVFTAHISRADGTFATYTYIGTDTGTTDGVITGTFPVDANGTNYRIRIISSYPYAVSEANLAGITVQGVHNGMKKYASTNGNWNDPLKWTPCGLPDMTDSIVIDGAVTVTVPEYYTAQGKSFTLANGAALLMDEGATLDYTGTIQIDNGSTMQTGMWGNMSVRPGAKLIVNGTLNNQGGINNSGTIGGSGTIIQNGDLYNQYGAFISPGNSAGTLTINGDLNLGESTLLIEVNGTTAGTLHDVLNVTGDVDMDEATLQIVQGAGYTFTPPYTITFINSGNLNNNFMTVLPAGTTVSYNMPSSGNASLIALAALPVKLTDFSVRQNETNNTIEWQTAAEESTDIFMVERSSNGKNFKSIGKIKAVGKANHYQLNDDQPLSGRSYYRLQMTANNDQGTYSKTLIVDRNNSSPINSITAIPNPAKESFSIGNIPGVLAGSKAVIYDAQGREYYHFQLTEGKIIQTGNWLPGTYFMKVANGQVLRLVKQ